MNHPSKQKYLVIIEIQQLGFVSKIFDSFEIAKEFSNDIFRRTLKVPFGDWNGLIDFLSELKYLRYECRGNHLHLSKYLNSSSNGEVSVSILGIDFSTFDIRSFIRERENHSIVFTDIPEEYLERYPSHYFIAN